MTRTKNYIPRPWTRWPRPTKRLPQEALMDFECSYDPRFDELVILVGVHLRGTRQRALRFVANERLDDFRHALEFAFVGFGGLPRRVELPWIQPFLMDAVIKDEEGRWVGPRINRLAQILGVPAFLPNPREPIPPAAKSLELIMMRVLHEFVLQRPREIVRDRNRALQTWVRQRGWDIVEDPSMATANQHIA